MVLQWLTPNSYWKGTCIMSTTSITRWNCQACSCLSRQKTITNGYEEGKHLFLWETDKEQQIWARTAVLLRFQDLISNFKGFCLVMWVGFLFVCFLFFQLPAPTFPRISVFHYFLFRKLKRCPKCMSHKN